VVWSATCLPWIEGSEYLNGIPKVLSKVEADVLKRWWTFSNVSLAAVSEPLVEDLSSVRTARKAWASYLNVAISCAVYLQFTPEESMVYLPFSPCCKASFNSDSPAASSSSPNN
jgi:hypothetical protein